MADTNATTFERDLAARVNELRWFHQIDLGGLITPGVSDHENLRSCAETYFADGVEGKSVLDIGCWDGFNSLEAVRRGASRVLATDHWVWAHHPWASRRTIELVRDVAAPALEIADADLFDLAPDRFGRFDVVLFCGVLYHLRDMFAGLERAAAMAREMLVVETHIDAADIDRPAAIFYPGGELGGDGSNWWGPNRACVEAMLWALGFQ